jgi:hypothetical protein
MCFAFCFMYLLVTFNVVYPSVYRTLHFVAFFYISLFTLDTQILQIYTMSPKFASVCKNIIQNGYILIADIWMQIRLQSNHLRFNYCYLWGRQIYILSVTKMLSCEAEEIILWNCCDHSVLLLEDFTEE